MDASRFTEKVREALSEAQATAIRLSHQQVDVEHLLVALLEPEHGLAPAIFLKAGIDVARVKRGVQQELDRLPKVSAPSGPPEQIYITGRLNRLLMQANDEAKQLKDDYTSVEHLLLAMVDDGGATDRLFKDLGLTRERLMQALQEVRGHQRVTSPNPEATYEALERYGRDLTRLAEQGKLDPVIVRDEEIRRVIQVLSRRTKNNPVLIGEPGVGKTAIVQLELTKASRTYLVRAGYDPSYGARPLKRIIQKEVETPLARRILNGEVRDGQSVSVDYDPKRGELQFTSVEEAVAATR